MKKITYPLSVLAIAIIAACNSPEPQQEEVKPPVESAQENPDDMLTEAYQLFKEGNDEASIELANRVLEIGKKTNDNNLIGRALTSLCRNSQRKQDTVRLAELSAQLIDLAETSGEQKWVMYQAHMNAEMWRLIGNMDKAETYYNESMRISNEIGAKGMYTIDHFNKSFVSVAKGDYDTAGDLIRKYYQLRKEDDPESEDAYGLIALSYLLEQQQNYEGAHKVAVVTRRLFEEQNLFPEPPDEKPLLAVEAKVKSELEADEYATIAESAKSETVTSLLDQYLN